MALFDTNPQTGRQFASIGEAVTALDAFNALYAVQQCDKKTELCGNADATAAWRKLIWDGVINAGGEPMELDFFESIFGGKTESIDAKKIHFRYNNDIDMNVYAQSPAVGAAVQNAVWFTLQKGMHSGGGKYSYPTKGYSVYIYEDKQWVAIVDEDKSTDYGHRFQVRPHKKSYKVNIRAGRKMMIMPTQFVGGLSGPTPSSSLQTTGYTSHVRPFRIRKDWELPIELNRGYEEILQWAIMFDDNGNEVDAWEPFIKTDARRAMKWAKNLIFYLGSIIDNPDLLNVDGAAGSNGKLTADYAGFDGYMPTLFYGGGQLVDFDPGIGFDLEADFEPIIFRNDSLKRTNEFLVMHPKAFIAGLNRNARDKFKNSTNITFETFKRMGSATSEDIKQLGVKSYEYLNFSFHTKEISAWSDSRGIGNFDIAQLAHFIPGNGLRDSKGREVPAFQQFMPKGISESGMLEEFNRDHRKIDGWDKIAGHMAETVMMAIHCPHLHILANPMMAA
jgi:hypothetical protein